MAEVVYSLRLVHMPQRKTLFYSTVVKTPMMQQFHTSKNYEDIMKHWVHKIH